MSLSSRISDLINIIENDIPTGPSSGGSIKKSSKSSKSSSASQNGPNGSVTTEKKVSEGLEIEDNDDDGETSLSLKTAKGTRDYTAGEMQIRESMMRTIKSNFDRFGGQSMETPVFELRDILMDKYGEDEKLIYELADQGGESLCLRYDLTVPLARFVAMRRKDLKSPFKAARVGRVYRRDQPRMTKGRVREFWQCDFDIVRTGLDGKRSIDLVLDDCEVVALVCSILRDLNFGGFRVLINNRKLLDAILEVCQVTPDLIRPISSAIDKLDKKDWIDVKCEMVEKGISGETAEKIYKFVQIKGTPEEVLMQLKANESLNGKHANATVSKNSRDAIKEFEMLLQFLGAYDEEFLKSVYIDMSMVRGLDYYTGLILEAQFADAELAAEVGSIAGGGRYDGLVGRFVKNQSFPCVGASIGFERIFACLKEQMGVGRGASTKVLVCELAFKGGPELGYFKSRLEVLQQLRGVGINAEIMNKVSPDFRDQINYAEDREIEWMVIIGEDEIKSKTVNLRRLTLPNDIVELKDGNKRAKILRIEQNENQKFPSFIVRLVDENGNFKEKSKEQAVNKKVIKKVVCNGKAVDLQIKGMPQAEFVEFLQSVL